MTQIIFKEAYILRNLQATASDNNYKDVNKWQQTGNRKDSNSIEWNDNEHLKTGFENITNFQMAIKKTGKQFD